MESTIIKKRKLCTGSLSEVCSSLDKICEHRESEEVAIKYFELGASTKLITYIELYDAWIEISGILRNARASRYVGIAADTPEYCLPALMLGTVSSGRAFVCLPPCASAIESITNKLKIRHLFAHDDSLETRTVCEFVAHGLKMFLRETKEPDLDSEESHCCDEADGAFAYATTTSGTTGEPKIVRVTHASIVANILDLKKILDVSARDVVAQITPLTFDPSMIEIFLPLSCEATVLVASRDLKNDPDTLLKTLTKSGVSVLQSTPSLLLQRWSCEQLKRSLLSEETILRILLLGGENFPNESVLSRIRSPNNRTRIFDIYGITEVSCWASIREIKKDNFSPGLGRTLSETILEVRDERGKKVIEGQGTLYIGSNSRICVIDDEDVGLLARPVFRDTGDIVEIDKDGHINLKGRRGRRIKRYGTKVYLTDLENHVQQLPFVENCYALFTESNQSLDLYFTLFDKMTSESEKSNYENDVSSHAKKLSDVHRPDKITALNQFELTSNGKICKKFLKQASRRVLKASNNDRSNAVKTFESIWRSLVSFEEEAGFLDSGGSSVIALRIANQLEEKSGHKLPKLMSYLLRNENFHVCREYIRGEVSNYEDGKKSAVESPDRFEQKIIEEPSQFVEKSTKQSEASEKMFPWQKCRGRSDFPVLAESERKTAWNKCTKIRPAYHYDLGKCVDASPTIFSYPGGKNYVTVGSHAGVICTAELTKENSPEQWEVSLPNRIEASILVVNDFRGVVGSYDSFVYCVHLKTGEQFWKFATGDIVKCTAVLCSRKETVFFGSYDRRMYCISLEDGSKVWSVKAGDGGICATPCVSDELNCVIFASLDGTCVSLAQNSGQINWMHRMDYPVFSGPTILETGFAVLCDVSGNLHCASAATGQTTWSVKIDGNIFSHLCTTVEADLRNILFASENRNIYRMDCSSEGTKLTLRYEKNVGAPIASTPFSDGRIIVVARNDGNLIILDSINAEILYNFKLGGDVFSSPVIHEDFIVVGCRDNRLYVLSRYDEDCCTEK